MSSLAQKYPVNFHIRASFVHLIDESGRSCGSVHIDDALRRARDAGLDLVQVSMDSNKPTCKIMDFGKFKYELSKQKQSSTHKTKELFITAHIGKHDLDTKVNKLKEFVSKKYSVLFGVKFKTKKEKSNVEPLKQMIVQCLSNAGVNADNVEFQYAPDKITVFIK
jgi:translation initiation factor IF-3